MSEFNEQRETMNKNTSYIIFIGFFWLTDKFLVHFQRKFNIQGLSKKGLSKMEKNKIFILVSVSWLWLWVLKFYNFLR